MTLHPQAANIAALEQAFEPHAAAVQQLYAEVAQLGDPRLHPAHLGGSASRHGQGSFRDVFHLPDAPGLAAKLYVRTEPENRPGFVTIDTATLTRIQGLDDFEQVAASSPKAGALIVHEFDGIPTEEATDDLLDSLTIDSLERVIRSVHIASADRKVQLDRNKGNVLIGATGLQLIDPHAFMHMAPLELNIETLVGAIRKAGETAVPVSADIRLGVLEKIRTIVQFYYPRLPRIQAVVERSIDATIEAA